MKDNKNVGLNIYELLKKNNSITRIVIITSTIICLSSVFFMYIIYQNSQKNIYAINETGELLPLKKIEDKEAKEVEVKADILLFIDYYYVLNSYNIKKKKEKILWLIGDQPKFIIKNRINTGYFDDFLTTSGLMQEITILENTFIITRSEEPYEAKVSVLIRRINGNVSKYYKANLKFSLINVQRNYPYNPYGLLINKFQEDLTEVNYSSEKELEKQIEEIEHENDKQNNQIN